MYQVKQLCRILILGEHLQVDVRGWRRFTMVLEWMGKNALLIYILVACNILPLILQGFYWKEPHNNIVSTCLHGFIHIIISSSVPNK